MEGGGSGSLELIVEPSQGVVSLNQRNISEGRCPLHNPGDMLSVSFYLLEYYQWPLGSFPRLEKVMEIDFMHGFSPVLHVLLDV